MEYMAIEASSSTNPNNDLDEDSWLGLVRQQWQAKGHDRFEELAQDAEAELKRKVAAVPEGEHSQPQRDALFQEFMQEMRGIARMQEEEVNALVEEEKREIRAYAKSQNASMRGGSVDSRVGGSGSSNLGASTSASAMSASTSASSSVPPSVDEKLLEEQRRLWDALRSSPYSNAVDDSGSSTEEETAERRMYNNRRDTYTSNNSKTGLGHGRARSGTISPPRATDHEQRSKSATVSPAPVYKPELTAGHTIYTPPASSNSGYSTQTQSQSSSHTIFVPAAPAQNSISTPKAPAVRRRTQSTSSTREIEMSKHVITPPSATNSGPGSTSQQSMYSQSYSQNQQVQQKHRVWIPPKPPHMVSAEINASSNTNSNANGNINGTTNGNANSNAATNGKDKELSNTNTTDTAANGVKKRPRPVSQLSTPSINMLTMTPTAAAGANGANGGPSSSGSGSSSSSSAASQRARSQDPTERKAEKLFGGTTGSSGGKYVRTATFFSLSCLHFL